MANDAFEQEPRFCDHHPYYDSDGKTFVRVRCYKCEAMVVSTLENNTIPILGPWLVKKDVAGQRGEP